MNTTSDLNVNHHVCSVISPYRSKQIWNIYTFAISNSDSFIPQILKVEGSLGKLIFSDPWDSGFLLQGGGGRGGAPHSEFCPPKIYKNNRKNNRNNRLLFKNNCLLSFALLKFFLAESQGFEIQKNYDSETSEQTNTELHKFDVMYISKNLSLFSSLNVFPKILNSVDHARVKIVNIYSNCSCLCFVHAGGVINLSLTFKMEFGTGKLKLYSIRACRGYLTDTNPTHGRGTVSVFQFSACSFRTYFR